MSHIKALKISEDKRSVLTKRFDKIKFAIWCARPLWWRIFSNWWDDNISTRLWPRNKWLTDVVPRHWCDKDGLMEKMLFAMLIHFVEKEECFETIDWNASGQKVFAQELRKYYDWLTRICPKQEAVMRAACTASRYEKYWRLKEKSEKKQTEILVWMVKNREYFWT